MSIKKGKTTKTAPKRNRKPGQHIEMPGSSVPVPKPDPQAPATPTAPQPLVPTPTPERPMTDIRLPGMPTVMQAVAVGPDGQRLDPKLERQMLANLKRSLYLDRDQQQVNHVIDAAFRFSEEITKLDRDSAKVQDATNELIQVCAVLAKGSQAGALYESSYQIVQKLDEFERRLNAEAGKNDAIRTAESGQ